MYGERRMKKATGEKKRRTAEHLLKGISNVREKLQLTTVVSLTSH